MRDPQFVENPCLLLGRHKAVIASDCFGTSCMNFRKRPNDSIRPTDATYRATQHLFGPPSGLPNQMRLQITILRMSLVLTPLS